MDLSTLRTSLFALEAERDRIEHAIAQLRTALTEGTVAALETATSNAQQMQKAGTQPHWTQRPENKKKLQAITKKGAAAVQKKFAAQKKKPSGQLVHWAQTPEGRERMRQIALDRQKKAHKTTPVAKTKAVGR